MERPPRRGFQPRRCSRHRGKALSRHSLGGVADEGIGFVERRVIRRIAGKLGVQTLGFRARRFLAAEHSRIRRRIPLDRDGGIGWPLALS